LTKKTPIEREFEFLIRRARKEGNDKLASQLEEKYEEVKVLYLPDMKVKLND